MNQKTSELISKRDQLRHEIYQSIDKFLDETGLRVTSITVEWDELLHHEIHVETCL